MIKHGKQICKSRKPKCAECSLLKQCPFGSEELGLKGEESEDEKVVTKSKRSWTSRRKTSVGDIEDLFIKKEESDTELMFVCGATVPVKKRKSL